MDMPRIMVNNRDNIRNLFKKIIADQCTDEEAALFFQLIRELPEDDALITELDSQWDNSAVDLRIDPMRGMHMQERIMRRIRGRQHENAGVGALTGEMEAMGAGAYQIASGEQSVRQWRTSWLRYAAAILLLFGGGVYFYLKQQKEKAALIVGKTDPVQNDVSPGSNNAVLILSNGQKIELGDSSMQSIHDAGITISKTNGELIYVSSDILAYNTMTTPRGGQFRLTLPDGTRVWLNAASSITYPTSFRGKQRKVEMTGEAYFEVAKNKSQPFFVKVNDATAVEAIGTRFNVNAYFDEDVVKTTLIEGIVRVNSGQDVRTIAPGQQVLAKNNGMMELREKADVEQIIAWTNGIFNFDKMPLEEVMRQLSRWYDISVVYEKSVPPITVGGKMGRDLTLSQALESLSELGVRYRLDHGKRLVILP